MSINAFEHIDKLSYYLKDGIPNGLFERLLAHNFMVANILVIIACLFFVFYLSRDEWGWKTFFIVCIPSIVSGFVWGVMMLYGDPNFPAWVVLPYGSLGEIWLWSTQDCIFNIATTILFYGTFRFLHRKKRRKDFKYSDYYKLIFMAFMIIASLFMIFWGAYCGRSLALMYGIPSIIFMIYAWNKINFKFMMKFLLVMILVETIWDWFAVSWIYHIKSWAPGWVYLSYDNNNILYYSKVFLDPIKHSWAWIFNNPIEITPWYGIVGATFMYTAIMAIDKLLKRNSL